MNPPGPSALQVAFLCAAFSSVAWMVVRELRAWRLERRESPIAKTVDALLAEERRR